MYSTNIKKYYYLKNIFHKRNIFIQLAFEFTRRPSFLLTRHPWTPTHPSQPGKFLMKVILSKKVKVRAKMFLVLRQQWRGSDINIEDNNDDRIIINLIDPNYFGTHIVQQAKRLIMMEKLYKKKYFLYVFYKTMMIMMEKFHR